MSNSSESAWAECCRTCADEGTATRAELIVWGKLFPEDALGPRCIYHFGRQTGYQTSDWMLRQTAVFDLRSVSPVKVFA